MTFIKTIPEEQAEGLVAEQYQAALENAGYVPNYVKAFSVLSPRPRLAVSLAKHSMRSAQNLMTHIWNSNLN